MDDLVVHILGVEVEEDTLAEREAAEDSQVVVLALHTEEDFLHTAQELHLGPDWREDFEDCWDRRAEEVVVVDLRWGMVPVVADRTLAADHMVVAESRQEDHKVHFAAGTRTAAAEVLDCHTGLVFVPGTHRRMVRRWAEQVLGPSACPSTPAHMQYVDRGAHTLRIAHPAEHLCV